MNHFRSENRSGKTLKGQSADACREAEWCENLMAGNSDEVGVELYLATLNLWLYFTTNS